MSTRAWVSQKATPRQGRLSFITDGSTCETLAFADNTPATNQLLATRGNILPALLKGYHKLQARPFLKWAGGKTRLLPGLLRCLPPNAFGRYFEPFLGGGALFFALAPKDAFLNDANAELMLCYEVVRDAPEDLLEALSEYRISEKEFYRIRSLEPESLPRVQRAARFIYLNKTCYNGLYRVNKRGEFNTPFGKNTDASLVDPKNVLAAGELLRHADLRSGDYETALDHAKKGDFVYLDPPYLPVSKYGDFKRYTRQFFYESDQNHLAAVFKELSSRGCVVLLSNSYHPKIASLYSDFQRLVVEVPRFINCKGEGRGNVKELLIANYGLPQSA